MAIVGHILLYQMGIHDFLQKWTFWCKKAKAKKNVVTETKGKIFQSQNFLSIRAIKSSTGLL